MAKRLDHRKTSRISKAKKDIRETIENGTFSNYSVQKKRRLYAEYECDDDGYEIEDFEETNQLSPGKEVVRFDGMEIVVDSRDRVAIQRLLQQGQPEGAEKSNRVKPRILSRIKKQGA